VVQTGHILNRADRGDGLQVVRDEGCRRVACLGT
jgi:hypothetical protein